MRSEEGKDMQNTLKEREQNIGTSMWEEGFRSRAHMGRLRDSPQSRIPSVVNPETVQSYVLETSTVIFGDH